jgi:hypothetical protein
MTEQKHDPIFREIDLSAEARRAWGPRWNAPELAYEFSNGRKFYLRTEDSGIYQPQVLENFMLMEDGSFFALDESHSGLLLLEDTVSSDK